MAEQPAGYRIGFGRPPPEHQFPKGRSGNPRGRPRGTQNLGTDLAEELAERIRIREGERTLRVSKQRALLKALLAKALKGDTRAASLVLQLVAKMLPPADPISVDDDLAGDDHAILERFLARQFKSGNET